MLSSGKYKSILNLEAKYDIFHEILKERFFCKSRFVFLGFGFFGFINKWNEF
jgi:hypothetical protein